MIHVGRLTEIARRKEGLVTRAARERAAIAAEFAAWHKPIEALDRGIAATRFLKAHPALVVVAVAVVVVLGRRRLLRWAGRGIVLWRSWRALQAWTHGLGA